MANNEQERKNTVRNCLYVIWFVPTFIGGMAILLELFVNLF